MIRVLIADDHATIRDSIAHLLEQHSELTVVGHAADGREAIELAQQVRPDVVVMDVSMPTLDGVAATRLLRDTAPDVRVVAFSTWDDDATRARMADAGASAYVTKGEPIDTLVQAIRHAARSANT